MSGPLIAQAEQLFHARFGAAPEGVVFAPGRVNLIGEHVDYNDGLVLPMPVATGTAVAWGLAQTRNTEVFAADFDEQDRFAAASPAKPATVGWQSYVRGMIAQWPAPPPAMRMLVTGDLARGSGLSSSASLCVAIGRALECATGQTLEATEMARRAQRTEHEFAGVACGIMDQMAVAAGAAREAMLLDCRSLAFTHQPIPQDWAVLVVDSGVTRGLVDGEYNDRRRQCEAAAAYLGVASLRDASPELLDATEMPALEMRRARHVIGEIARVNAAANALQQGNISTFGKILNEGHASLRDLFEVSHPEVDALVAELQGRIGSAGGARMTGAGFGGSVVAVLPSEMASGIEQTLDRPHLRVC